VTMYVYPRLPYSFAQLRLQEIIDAYNSGGFDAVRSLVAFEHEYAHPVATGGVIAGPDKIREVRESVLDASTHWRERGSTDGQAAAFDLAVGRALHEALEIIPSDAAHGEFWNFITILVLPDIAVLRFPDMHPDRMLGSSRRNTFRRIWSRRDVLGDLTDRYEKPLGEDEMTGLFERSAMARNRELIRTLASIVMERDEPGARSDWARTLYKKARYVTGPRALDGFTESEINELIRAECM
jgi:hypothetical protein